MVRIKDRSGMPGNPSDPLPPAMELTALQLALLEELSAQVRVKLDGVEQWVSKETLATKKLTSMALGGNSHAMSRLFREANQAQAIRQGQIARRAEIGKRWKATQQSKLDALKANGQDTRLVLPHPDDIDLLSEDGFALTGPLDVDDLKRVENSCAMRDAALVQAALEHRLGPEPGDIEGVRYERGTSAYCLMMFYNSILPARFRLMDAKLHHRLMRLESLSKRELLKRSHQAWKAAGRRVPRGFRFPTADRFLPFFGRLQRLTNEELKRTRDGFPSSLDELAGEMQDLLALLGPVR